MYNVDLPMKQLQDESSVGSRSYVLKNNVLVAHIDGRRKTICSKQLSLRLLVYSHGRAADSAVYADTYTERTPSITQAKHQRPISQPFPP